MILRQYVDVRPVVATSYLFGCGGKAMGAVVDPTDDIGRYLRDAEELGLDRETFVRHMLQDIPHPPPRAAEVRAANLGWHGAAA